MSTWADETQSITISTHGATGSVFAECSVINNKCVLWMHRELSGGNAETSHIWCVSCPVLFVAQTWCWHQPRPRRLWNFVHDNIKRALAQSSSQWTTFLLNQPGFILKPSPASQYVCLKHENHTSGICQGWRGDVAKTCVFTFMTCIAPWNEGIGSRSPLLLFQGSLQASFCHILAISLGAIMLTAVTYSLRNVNIRNLQGDTR